MSPGAIVCVWECVSLVSEFIKIWDLVLPSGFGGRVYQEFWFLPGSRGLLIPAGVCYLVLSLEKVTTTVSSPNVAGSG